MIRQSPAIGVAIAFAVLTNVSAETITVCAQGCDYANLQDAAEAASYGDTILLAAGDYSPISVEGIFSSFTVVGSVDRTTGHPTSIISGGGASRCVTANSGPLVFENIQFSDGYGNQAGAVLTQGPITFTNCRFSDNRGLGSDSVGGLKLSGGGLIQRCSFVNNQSDAGTGAILIGGAGPATLIDVRFELNRGPRGGAIRGINATYSATSCRFTENSASVAGGAIYSQGVGSREFSSCTFERNAAPSNSTAHGPYHHFSACSFDACCRVDTNTPATGYGLGNTYLGNGYFACDDCRANLDCQDQAVDASDLGYLLARWGTDDPQSDIDGDGVVLAGDLGLLVAAWGPCD